MPKYKLLVEDYNVTPFVIYHLNHVMGKRLKNYMEDPPTCLFEFDDGNVNWYMEFEKWNHHGQRIVDDLIDDPSSYDKFNDQLREDVNTLKDKSHNLYHGDVSQYGVQELWKTYNDTIEVFETVYERGMIPTIADLDTPFLSERLQETLQNYADTPNEAFVTLTRPTEKSDILQEEMDLLELKLKDNQSTDEELQSHHNKYFWLTHGYEGPLYTIEKISEKLGNLDVAEAKDRYEELQNYESRVQSQIENLIDRLGLSEEVKKLFQVAREWLFLKGIRKESFFACYAAMDKVAKAMSDELGISKKELKHLTRKELQSALFEGKVPDSLEKRSEESVYIFKGDKDVVKTGSAAKEHVEKHVVSQSVDKLDEIEGQVAFSGKVTGTAKLISEPEDMEKMNDGDVLISPATNPNLLPAMKQAAAIVTDVGGITCHAAITSREIETPCVIGTEVATKVFEDGDEVKVNAEDGFVEIIKN